MRRKKVTNESDVIDAIPELDDNEQFVIEDRKTIRKERIKDAEPEPEIVIDDDPSDDEPERQSFSQTSLAALIYGEGQEEPLEYQFCSVHVRRNPDSMNDRFLIPNAATLTLPPLRNIEMSAEKSEIEEMVRREHGGGHYFFQLHFGGSLRSSWKVSLADDPETVRQSKAFANPLPVPAPQPPPVNPVDQFFDGLRKQKEMKDLLFGDEQRRYELEQQKLQTEIERLRIEAARPAANQSDLALLLSAMKDTNSPGLIEFARDYLSPENKEPAFGVWDFAKYLFENRSEFALLAGSLLGGLLPSAPTPQGIEAMLKQAPPSTPAESPPMDLPPVRSGFQRKRVVEAEDAIEGVIDNDIDSDAAGMEAAEPNDAADKSND